MSLVLGHVGQNVGKIGLHIQFCSFFVTLLSNYLPAAGWQIPKITHIEEDSNISRKFVRNSHKVRQGVVLKEQ